MFFDVLLHPKTKQEFMFCFDNAKVHLKADYNQDIKSSHVLTKLVPRIILKLFLNLSNFEPQNSFKLNSYKKRVYW